ncbi:MAG TPA: magnesium transporter CorA family protein [Streptosporangiaceae bacterium]|nr:magnesium transporter CorA family protein [Streptosporangiaceae bacterium]
MDGKLILIDGSTAPLDEVTIKGALADGKLLWLDFKPADPDGIAMLRDDFKMHPVAIEAVTEFGQRPRVEDFGNVVYLVSYGVTGQGKDDLTEVHIFIAKDFVITIRKDHCHALDELWDRLGRPGGLPVGTGRPVRLILVHHILDSLIDSFFPRLSEFDDRIDELQEQIFAKPSNDQLAELFNMQRWLVNVRKLVAPQRDMVASLVAGMVNMPGMTEEGEPYLRDLYDHTIRISDQIDSYRDLLSNAMSAYLSMVSNNLNEVMKQLAIIATIFLPLSFLTGFFGQNFAWLVSGLGGWPTFVIVGLGTEVVAVAALYWLFRRRGWIGGSR